MKKLTSFILMIVLSFGFGFAQSVSQNEAESIAKDFLVKSTASSMQKAPAKVDLQLVYQKTDKQQTSDKLLYIYNVKGGNGFVVVSADKRTKSILGYSDSGSFDAENMPVNLQNWLEGYAEQIKFAKKNLKEVSDKEFALSMSRVAQNTTEVEPLLGTIAFNQGTPYNDLCPEKNGERTVTGCVATAIVQVMKYHNHPNQGKGSHSYQWNGQTLSVDYSTETYDWTKITPSYNQNSTDDEKAEIAKLMYHIGVSVDMDYDLASNGGSGAVTGKAVQVLYENFDYDAGIQSYKREYFSTSEWTAKLKEELDNGRPIIYSGRGNGGGHAFVCDGYDADGKFHMNWGWGGSSNGYFELGALNPSNLGTGGGNGGYNFNQQIIAGIQTPVTGSQNTQILGMEGFNNIPDEVNRIDNFSLNLKKLFNIGGFEHKDGKVELVLMQNNILVEQLHYFALPDLPRFAGWHNFPFDDISIPNTVVNGNYQIIARYKNEKDEMVPVWVKHRGIKVIDVEITDTKIQFTATEPSSTLTLAEAPTTLTNLYQNKKGQFKFKLSNTGTADYYAQVGVKLVKKDDNTVTQELFHSVKSVPMGTTEKEFSIITTSNITVPAGDYYLEVYYDENNDLDDTGFPTTLLEPTANNRVEVTVLPEPTEEHNLSAANISMPSTVTIGEDFEFTADITNTGGYYEDKIIVWIYPKAGGTSVGYFGFQDIIVDKNQTKTIHLTHKITDLEQGEYQVALKTYEQDGAVRKLLGKLSFQLVEKSTTNLSNTVSKKIGVSQIDNTLFVTLPKSSQSVRLFNAAGQLVYQNSQLTSGKVTISTNGLNRGIFLLQVVDAHNNNIIRKVRLIK